MDGIGGLFSVGPCVPLRWLFGPTDVHSCTSFVSEFFVLWGDQSLKLQRHRFEIENLIFLLCPFSFCQTAQALVGGPWAFSRCIEDWSKQLTCDKILGAFLPFCSSGMRYPLNWSFSGRGNHFWRSKSSYRISLLLCAWLWMETSSLWVTMEMVSSSSVLIQVWLPVSNVQNEYFFFLTDKRGKKCWYLANCEGNDFWLLMLFVPFVAVVVLLTWTFPHFHCNRRWNDKDPRDP